MYLFFGIDFKLFKMCCTDKYNKSNKKRESSLARMRDNACCDNASFVFVLLPWALLAPGHDAYYTKINITPKGL